MAGFARTELGGVSAPLLVCGTNRMPGFSYQMKTKDQWAKGFFDILSKRDLLAHGQTGRAELAK